MAGTPTDLKSKARGFTDVCLKTLAGVVKSPKCPPSARVTAALGLLDRGWGKPDQGIVGADGGDIKIIIRQIIETTQEIEPLLIEHEDGSDK